MNHEFMMEYESFHTRVMILMNLITSVLPTEFPVSLNSMLPIGYPSRKVQRKPILDLDFFAEKFIEPKIDLKARTGRIWTFPREKLVSECQ